MKGKTTPKTPKTPRTPKRKEPKLEDGTGADKDKENDSAKRPKQQPIMNFFQRVDKPAPPPTLPPSILNARFKPFQLKEGMRLAPVHMRRPLSETEHDNFFNKNYDDEFKSDFLSNCARKKKKRPASNTEPTKAKLYQFHDNYRPPYYGTWRHRNEKVTGRRVFNKNGMRISLDGSSRTYEEDSDDDWEDEPADGDECNSDEEMEKEEEVTDEEETDDGFLVDHGYLSKDEGSDGDDEDEEGAEKAGQSGARKSDGGGGGETEEQRRKRLEQKNQEWQEAQRQKERRARKRELKPILYMPEEGAQQVPHIHRNCRPGVLFDYSKLVQPAQAPPENNDEELVKLEAMEVSEFRWAQAPPTIQIDD